MATDPPRRRRHPPAVYRRRRLALLLGVIVVIAVVWLLIAQPWQSSAAETPGAATGSTAQPAAPAITDIPVPAAATPSPTPSPTPDAPSAAPSPGPSETPAAKACRTSDVTVEAVTDQTGYSSDQNPQLSMTLTNHGDTDCTLNVGTAAQTFTITSGTDTWWRSTDCQTEPSDMVVLLTAGQTVSSAAPLVWDRTRSSVESCDDGSRQHAVGGGATYQLAVSIGGISSLQPTMFMLY